MGFREFLEKIDKETVSKPVSKKLEASAILDQLGEKAVLFEDIKESDFRVGGNLFTSKQRTADYLGCKVSELIPTLTNAIDNPSKPEEVSGGECQEVELDSVDLDKLPILFHTEADGGNYVSSGVVVSSSPAHGQNLDFHRCMQISKNKFSVRIVSTRNFDEFLQKQGEMPIAVCVGNGANTLIAAAISVEIGKNEEEIANTLSPLQVTKAKTSDLLVPADSEFVLEGIIRLADKSDEGPFVDLTETVDVVRQEPVFEVKKITHRKDAIWQALLPGKLEHKLLMGMPREPTMFREVNSAGVKCLDVNVNPGGCSWLHGLVKIDKQSEEDGKKAIEGAFKGHKSCKHIFVVDKDIDIYNPLEVEWAMATRFQASDDFVMKEKEPGSSLDPSAESKTKMTSKCGFDCTAKLEAKGKNFGKAVFPKVELEKFLGGEQ